MHDGPLGVQALACYFRGPRLPSVCPEKPNFERRLAGTLALQPQIGSLVGPSGGRESPRAEVSGQTLPTVYFSKSSYGSAVSLTKN